MGLQVLVGIPWLAGVIGALFTSIFQWALNFFTKKLAVVVAVVAVIGSVTVAFFAAIELLFVGIAAGSPQWVSDAAQMVVPSNTTACLTAIASAYVLKWAYSWQVRILQYKLF